MSDAVTSFTMDDFGALTIAIIVFFAGAILTRRISLLRDYNIPEPVSGGLFAALVALLIYKVFDLEISYALETRDLLLVYFFTAIGLNARFDDLVKGGKPLAILLALGLAALGLAQLFGAHVERRATAEMAVQLDQVDQRRPGPLERPGQEQRGHERADQLQRNALLAHERHHRDGREAVRNPLGNVEQPEGQETPVPRCEQVA